MSKPQMSVIAMKSRPAPRRSTFLLAPFGGMIMNVTSKSGAAIAAAAALFLAGMTMSTDAQAADGHCMGANACKGQSACKGGKSPGPGGNACKGQGFATMSKEDCVAAKGKFKPA
jgi:acetyl/propionyl-CoA carboxylase alpha subunit